MLNADGAELNFTGLGDLDGTVDGTAQLSIPQVHPLAQFAGLDWSGAGSLTARFRVSRDTQRVEFDLSGAVQQPVTGIAALDAALGDAASLAASGTLHFNGATEVARAALIGNRAELSVSGQVDPAGPVNAQFTLSAADLSAFAGVLKQPVTGAAQVTGNVTGTTAEPNFHLEATSPGFSVASRTVRNLKLAADIAGLARPSGTVNGRARVLGLDTNLQSALTLQDGVLTFSDAAVRAGPTNINGAIAITLKTSDVSGNLTIDSRDLSPWSALANLPLKGRASGKLTLKPDGSAAAEATASSLVIGDVTLADLRMKASLPHWRDQMTGRIDAEARQVTRGAISLEAATLRVEPRKDAFGIDFTGSGVAGAPFTIDAQGTYDAIQRRLALAGLSGRYADKPVMLRKATSFSFGRELALTPFELDWGNTTIAGDVTLGAKYSGRIRLNGLPVRDIGAVAGRQNLHGTAQATLALSGTSANPNAQLTARITNFAFADASKQSPTGDLSVDGTFDPGGSRLAGRFEFRNGRSVGAREWRLASRVEQSTLWLEHECQRTGAGRNQRIG